MASLDLARCNTLSADFKAAIAIHREILQNPDAAASVADSRRPEADKARDATRKPAETVTFAGVKPGDKVAELRAADDCSSELATMRARLAQLIDIEHHVDRHTVVFEVAVHAVSTLAAGVEQGIGLQELVET